MTKKNFCHLIICAVIAITNAGFLSPCYSQASGYDTKLTRLAEVLGSLHYLYNLCGNDTTVWRDKMSLLLNAENPSKSQKLTSAFNTGYQAFSENYLQCTPAAISAIEFYSNEGKKLSEELVARFGN